MNFFSNFFNIIIALFIVSTVIYSIFSGRVPKEGTPARKKYDKKMKMEEWERLNPPTYKTIEEISIPKPKISAAKNQKYKEPEISQKMIVEFVTFLKKFQSKDKHKPFYSTIDFRKIDFGSLRIDFSLMVGLEIILHELGNIKCDELEYAEKGYLKEIYSINHIIDIEYSSSQDYANGFEELVRLIHNPNSFDAIKSNQNDGIFYGDPLDWIDTSSDETIGIFFETGRELDPNKIAAEFYYYDLFESNRTNYSTGSVGDYEVENFKIDKIDFPYIDLSINGQAFTEQFKFKKSHQKYILILLMCVCRKDLSNKVNDALEKSL